MRDPARIDDTLNIIGMVWKLAPDQRLGQLLTNVAGMTLDGQLSREQADIFNLEDDSLVFRLGLYAVALMRLANGH